ncbi:MFS transporter [Streptomyces sp. NBC_00019]|uniref:MFS transporter n=1 Tax=Streptomyces sp. NBC_00019 TaxID=2975623 RepID=UPI0038666E6C
MNLLDTTVVQWFGTAYTLPFAVLLITGGRLGDIGGRRRVFVLGVIGFTLASIACALAPTPGVLIGFRAVQGAVAALVVPQTIGLIRAMFSGPELFRALAGVRPPDDIIRTSDSSRDRHPRTARRPRPRWVRPSGSR